MQKIQRFSSLFKVVFQLAILVKVLFFLASWIAILIGYTQMQDNKWIHFSTGFFRTSMDVLILCFLIKLFANYMRNEIFTLKNSFIMRKIGVTLLVKQIILPLYINMTAILFHHPIHTTGFYESDFESIILALIIILNSWITAEGHKIKDEQQLTV